ncbi:MAG: hypothetical protein K2Y14_07265 [Burkholderiales bacterium]|nr:hypothetical protein [Burkholderiales bacterium]
MINLFIYIAAFSFIIAIAGILFKNFKISIIGILPFFSSLFIVLNLSYLEPTKYVEIKRIDSTKYIQCIESQQYIVSSGSNSADAVTTMLDATGKTIKCSNSSIIYTQDQTELPINKDKDFIIKEVQF